MVTPQGQFSGCLVRLFWMFLGNVVLLFSAKAISDREAYALSIADLVFWGFVLALIIIRRVDISKLGGLTAAGQPASMVHWRRYAIVLLVLALVLWGSAHGIAALTS
jgi:hypothetical protein